MYILFQSNTAFQYDNPPPGLGALELPFTVFYANDNYDVLCLMGAGSTGGNGGDYGATNDCAGFIDNAEALVVAGPQQGVSHYRLLNNKINYLLKNHL